MKQNQVYKTAFVIMLTLFSLYSFADKNEDLIKACRQGDVNAVQNALDAGADVNATDESGNTAIGNAYFWPDITKLLIEKGADVNGGNYPALASASSAYSTEVVKLLLDAGADPNKTVMVDNSETIKKLLEEEKEKGKKNANKYMIKAYEKMLKDAKPVPTPLVQMFLMGSNHVAALKMLIDKGMKLELENGNNALHIFVDYCNSKEMRQQQWTESAEKYTSQGFKVPEWISNLPDDKNASAVEMLEVLLAVGLDANKANNNGLTPLCNTIQVAIFAQENTKYDKINVAKKLIEKGADVNAISTLIVPKGWSYNPICLAAEAGDLSLIKTLVEKGANIDAKVRSVSISLFSTYASVSGSGGDDYTALVIAILAGKNDIASYLISKGADLTIGSQGFAIIESSHANLKCLCKVKNKTPLFWAIDKGNMDLIKSIVTGLAGKKLPDFSAMAIGDVDKSSGYVCVKFKKSKYSPSEYADLLGYGKGLVEYLESNKL